MTYGQTEILLLFGKIIGEAEVKDVQEMTASNVGLRMMTEEAGLKNIPLTQDFIRTQTVSYIISLQRPHQSGNGQRKGVGPPVPTSVKLQ